jgi:hypothetical protein
MCLLCSTNWGFISQKNTFFKEHIDSAIKEQLSYTWHRNLQGLDTNNMKDTWRKTKNLTKSNPNIPRLNINGKTATTTEEKLNLYCGYIGTRFHYQPRW